MSIAETAKSSNGWDEMARSMVRRTRQNHGLEHGTVTVLLEQGVRPPLAGYATPGGFFVYGRVSEEQVSSAASEALGRLQAGKRETAVSRYCGTNLAVGALIAAVLSGLILRRSRRPVARLPLLALGVLCATWLREPVGNMVQRHLTTLADAGDVRIGGVRSVRLGRFAIHRVRTDRVGPR